MTSSNANTGSNFPDIPCPSGAPVDVKTAASRLERLKKAQALLDDIRAGFDKMFPMQEGIVRLDLSALSVDERIALGNEAIAKMAMALYQISPSKALDAWEEDLASHAPSREEAAALLARVSGTDKGSAETKERPQ